jgi:hypothetical protein
MNFGSDGNPFMPKTYIGPCMYISIPPDAEYVPYAQFLKIRLPSGQAELLASPATEISAMLPFRFLFPNNTQFSTVTG